MATKSVTVMNTESRTVLFNSICEQFPGGIQTDSATITLPLEREDGKAIYASIKVSIHKEGFDVEEKAGEYQEKVRAAAEKAEAKRKKDEADRLKREEKAKEKAEKEAAGE